MRADDCRKLNTSIEKELRNAFHATFSSTKGSPWHGEGTQHELGASNLNGGLRDGGFFKVRCAEESRSLKTPQLFGSFSQLIYHFPPAKSELL